MGDGRSDVRSREAWEQAQREGRTSRLREEIRARLCDELLSAAPGTTREEVMQVCGVNDADAFELLGGRCVSPIADAAAMQKRQEHVYGSSGGAGANEAQSEAAEEAVIHWGEAAVELSGFRWLPGMRLLSAARVLTTARSASDQIGWLGSEGGWTPHLPRILDVDDEGTAGCLLSMLGSVGVRALSEGGFVVTVYDESSGVVSFLGEGSTLGRACVSAARACGGWSAASSQE